METTYEGGRQGLREAGNNGSELRSRTSRVSSEVKNLIADVEDLVKKVANVSDAEVARVRERVEKTLTRAKTAASEGAGAVKTYARHATVATDEYVHDSPWTAIGVAAAIGVLVGFLVTRR